MVSLKENQSPKDSLATETLGIQNLIPLREIKFWQIVYRKKETLMVVFDKLEWRRWCPWTKRFLGLSVTLKKVRVLKVSISSMERLSFLIFLWVSLTWMPNDWMTQKKMMIRKEWIHRIDMRLTKFGVIFFTALYIKLNIFVWNCQGAGKNNFHKIVTEYTSGNSF